MRRFFAGSLALTLVTLCAPSSARADVVPKEYEKTIEKGLTWLAKQQKTDGSWEGPSDGNRWPVAMTSMSGMALLAEGSTLREGRYRTHIRKARDFLLARAQNNGLIARTSNPEEARNYMHGHGFAMLFLASLVGEEENVEMRTRLVQVLERAAKFAYDAQSDHGGWWYISAKEERKRSGRELVHEGSLTVTLLQGLRAARNAGIVVPSESIRKGVKYLQASTRPDGGVRYSLTWDIFNGQGRPALTAAAISCGFSAGEYQGDLIKKWLKYSRDTIPGADRTINHYEYTHLYYAQVIYVLGDDRFQKLFPDAKDDELLTWTRYRKQTFDVLKELQKPDGSWVPRGGVQWEVTGPVYATAIYLTIMQLDKGTLPIYQR